MPVMIYAGSYASYALTKTLLNAARGTKLTFKAALPSSAVVPLQFFVTCLLTGLAVLGGFILLVVPGIIFGTWFSAATYINVDEGVWGVAALKRSRELTRGRNWDTLGTIMLPSCFSILNFIPVLGPLVTTVLTVVLMPLYAVRYTQLVELKKRTDWQTVPTHPINYVVVIAGLLLTGTNSSHSFMQSLNQAQLEKNIQPY